LFLRINIVEDASVNKPIAQSYSWRVVGAFFWISTIGIFVLFSVANHFGFNPCFCDSILLARYFQKWIDGYTGGCLGNATSL
jgi:adenosylcobinamide-GDP ribazoletransferase